MEAATSSTEATPARPTRENRDLAVAALTTVTASLPAFLVGTLAVEMREALHFGAAQLGLAVTFYYLGAAAVAVPFGRLTHQIGGVRVMRAATLAGAALLALLAIATHSWSTLAVLMGLCGVTSASVGTATNQFLARRLRPEHQGAAFGVKQAAVPLASLLGGLAVPAIALTIGWRWAFGLAAVLALIAALTVPPPTTTLAARREQNRLGPRPVIAVAPLVLLGAGLGLGVATASGLNAFLVTAGVAIAFDQGTVGLIAALASAAAVVVRISTGYRADKRGSGHLPVVAAMMLFATVGDLVLALASASHTKWLFVVGAIVALGIGWGWNGLFNFAVIRTHMQAPARASGIVQVGGRLGGVVGPLGVGLLAEHTSFPVAWVVTACTGLLGAAAVVAGRYLLRRSRGTTP